MIEIVNTHNLKNITQIGTPGTDEEKIYIEDSVYTRIHVDEFRDKRVFVFMGHTECESGRYKTFLEGVIPVYDMEFKKGVPVWNNHAWSEVFREIKRNYTDSIIVGWAFDQRGIKPSATSELEAVHREHFGGIHQLLFLMDTTAGDESFYILRSNRLYPKAGFYIFYSTVKIPVPEPVDLEVEWVKQEYSASRRVNAQPQRVRKETYSVTQIPSEAEEMPKKTANSGGYYRRLLQESEQKVPSGKRRNPAVAIVVLILLVGIAGVAISKNQEAVKEIQTWVSSVGAKKGTPQSLPEGNAQAQELTDSTVENEVQNSESQAVGEDAVLSSESQTVGEDAVLSSESQAVSGEVVPEIPVEKVDGGIETGN